MSVSEIENRRHTPLWIILLAFAILAGFLVLVAWGLAHAQPKTLQLGDPAPDFSMTTFDGKSFNTADLRNKVIVVNFWASWCETCKDEAVFLENVWQYYKAGDDVVILGVDYVDTEPKALKYLEEFGITYPNGADLRSGISRQYFVTGVPETYIIDKQGRLAYSMIGPFSSETEIRTIINKLLEN